ncbi:hypothetical protein Dimus_036171 [Dionaea muscipula]
MVLGDFNNVFASENKANGVLVTDYELKDQLECRRIIGLSDLNYTRCHFTWSNNRTWYKLDSLSGKLKALKGPLKQLNVLHFSHISARADQAKKDLHLVHQQLHDGPWDM